MYCWVDYFSAVSGTTKCCISSSLVIVEINKSIMGSNLDISFIYYVIHSLLHILEFCNYNSSPDVSLFGISIIFLWTSVFGVKLG